MTRAERRHRNESIKNRFRRIERSRAPRVGKLVLVRKDPWTVAPLNWIEREYWIERAAVRVAFTPRRCSCWLCKRERYDRNEQRGEARRLLREEA